MLLRTRFLAALLSAAVAAACAMPAVAQSAKRGEQAAKRPQVSRGERPRNLDFLFGALKLAPDDTTAKSIEERIWSLWTALAQRHRKSSDDTGEDRDRGKGSRPCGHVARRDRQDKA